MSLSSKKDTIYKREKKRIITSVTFEFARGVRDKVRGEYRFSSVVKQKIKAKICFVIHIAGFFLKKQLCYEVIVKQKNYKRPTNYY